MSRQPVLMGFAPHTHALALSHPQSASHPHTQSRPRHHAHPHPHTHAGPASHYQAALQAQAQAHAHARLAFARPLPTRAPVLAPARFTHQPTGQLHHGRPQSLTMADQPYMASDEDIAHLQKLSSEYEPDATVSYTAATHHPPSLTPLRARW